MLRWLTGDFRLTTPEAHLVIGMRARSDIITLGGSVGLRFTRRDIPPR